jgi:hypothetical protein
MSEILLSYTVGAEHRPVARLKLDDDRVVVHLIDGRHAAAVATYLDAPHYSVPLGRAVTLEDGGAFLESVLTDLATSTYWSACVEPREVRS